jgi:type II secretory pathway component PulF
VGNRKISSARQTVKKALSVPVVIMLSLAIVAVAVSVLGLVPDLLRHEGVQVPASLRFVFQLVDLAGEILLGFFALLIVFKIWDKRR